MFKSLTLRGKAASIRWAYHDAAVLRQWTITKSERGAWALSAGIDRADRFKLAQKPLRFIAPRKGGYWCWPVLSVVVGKESLTAQLGPPEQ